MSKWNPNSIKAIPEPIPGAEMKKKIEQVAEILYEYFCQLDKDQSQSTGHETENHDHQRRSGTYA